MDTQKYDYNSVHLEIEYNISPVFVASQKLPHIPGRIIGFATTTRRENTTIPVKLQLTDGGTETHRPFDTAFSETTGRSSFADALVPLNIGNPGQIEAAIIIPQALAPSEKVTVDVLIVSEA